MSTIKENRWMRLLVLFDLPVVDPIDRKNYTIFRRFLLNDGYDMLQFSVYARISNGYDVLEKHFKRLTKNLPPKGSVRCMRVTEKQFADLVFLVGKPSNQEKKVDSEQLLLF